LRTPGDDRAYVRVMGAINGKVVFITGAARGIGAEVAGRLHGKGARLVLTDVDDPPLAALATRLGGERILTSVADVRDAAAMKAVAEQAVQRFGGIDVVVANAGVACFGSVLNVDPAAFKRVVDINLTGVFNTVQAALPSVVERRGYVLVVSSLAAYVAGPGMAAYNGSKAGVEHFANALRLEVGALGVDVGSAHMSWIDTPLVQEAKAELGAFNQMLAAMPGPLRKTTSVEECGAAFVKGIEGRRRHIYCPGWVGLLRWLRPVAATPLAERDRRESAPDLLLAVDAQAAEFGRNFSARNEALEKGRPGREAPEAG
jgi:NAD(P)-dependent dehydrogenase (short-subunit alcohol dehydrogenase family)